MKEGLLIQCFTKQIKLSILLELLYTKKSMIFILIFFSELLVLFFLSRLLTRSISNLLLRITKSQNTTIQLLSFLFLPGIIIHELAHLLIAGMLFVPVGEIEFMPQIKEGGVKLGSVAIGKTDPVRRAIIGVAPVFAGLAVLFAIFSFAFNSSNALILLGGFYGLFAVSNTMFSSRKDIEGLLEVLIVSAIIFLALYFIGFGFPEGFANYFSSNEFMELVKRANLFMLVPLGIDALIYIVAIGSWKSQRA